MPSEDNSKPRKGPTRKRKNTALSVENHYKILGVRVNATPNSIKQGYIAKIKEFPPEQFPEEFQKIRSAYEILRDPAKRSEYDFTRKYGDSVDSLLMKGIEAEQAGDDTVAETCYRKVLEISPLHIGANASLARVYLSRDQMALFETQWAKLMETTDNDQEHVAAATLKCQFLLEFEKYEAALQHMQDLDKHYRSQRKYYIFYLARVLDLNDKSQEGWRLIEETAPDVKEQQPGDLTFFIHWVLAMFDMEKRQFWSKVKQRFRIFLRSLTDPDDKEFAVDTLLEESRELSDSKAFREAHIFAELAYYLDPKNPAVTEQRQLVRNGASLISEIDRLVKDSQIYPGVIVKAISFFAQETGVNDLDDLEESFLPPEMLQEMDMLAEFMLSGIKLLQRKYPLVYQQYKHQWDKLANEKASGLNREARRRLR
ncbi:DnaJ domain-containing protein [Paenibacillus sp. BR2-3]|uniref:DnaJ domain-containing protein n=1 Tax=Paenibacillus sp. BR2-3 TaxID=3048494 RepID=UPI00397741A6